MVKRIGDILDADALPQKELAEGAEKLHNGIPIPVMPADMWEWMGLHDAIEVNYQPLISSLLIYRLGAAIPATDRPKSKAYRLERTQYPFVFDIAVGELRELVRRMLWSSAPQPSGNTNWLCYRGRPPVELRSEAAALHTGELSVDDVESTLFASGLTDYHRWLVEYQARGFAREPDGTLLSPEAIREAGR